MLVGKFHGTREKKREKLIWGGRLIKAVREKREKLFGESLTWCIRLPRHAVKHALVDICYKNRRTVISRTETVL